MQIRNPCSPEKRIQRKDHDELLDCRMAMLGLDLFAIKSDGSDKLEEIMRSCASCGYREACAVDLKRDPNSPVWETYCPNAEALLELTGAAWLAR